MICNQFRDRIVLYIKNELSDYDLQEFTTHLDACLECQKEYNQLVETDRILTNHLELAQAPRIASAANKKIKWPYLATAAATLLVASIFIGRELTNHVQDANLALYQTQAFNSLMDLDYDSYRILFDQRESFSLTGQTVDEDFFDNYLYELNKRIDYLNKTEF